MEQCWELDGSQPLLEFLSKILNSSTLEQFLKLLQCPKTAPMS